MTVLKSPDAAFQPKVSVIMNCLNGEKYVRAAIESVYAQTYKNWEIIFLDNASSDGTPPIAKSFDNRLRYFRNEVTVPLGTARNQALKQAGGEYIAFLDCDDFWHPEKLTKQIPLFQNRPQLGLVFSDTEIRHQGSGKITTYFYSHQYKPPRGRIFSALLLHYSIPMLTTVVKAESLRAMDSWFDDEYRVCDDFDFFMRIAYDWECDYIDEPLASHLVHEEAATVKFHRFGAIELKQTIQKFGRRHPDFEKRYANELKQFHKRVSFMQGKSYWQAGDRKAARNEFRNYLSTPKFLVGYIATAFPYQAFEKVARHIRR
jgi:glycosyltransferase involved in cell wall biosynthesis